MLGSSEAAECSVTDMQKGKSYRYRICAQNQHGKGPYVDLPDPVLANDPPTVPNCPRSLTYSNVKKDSVCLSWALPSSDGGEPITGEHCFLPCYHLLWLLVAVIRNLCHCFAVHSWKLYCDLHAAPVCETVAAK